MEVKVDRDFDLLERKLNCEGDVRLKRRGRKRSITALYADDEDHRDYTTKSGWLERLIVIRTSRRNFLKMMNDRRNRASIELYRRLLFFFDFKSDLSEIPQDQRDCCKIEVRERPEGDPFCDGGWLDVPVTQMVTESPLRCGTVIEQEGEDRSGQQIEQANVNSAEDALYLRTKDRYGWLWVMITYYRRAKREEQRGRDRLFYLCTEKVHFYDAIDSVLQGVFKIDTRHEYLTGIPHSLQTVHCLSVCLWILIRKEENIGSLMG